MPNHTPERIAELRRLLGEATEGPWETQSHGATVTDANGDHRGAWEVTGEGEPAVALCVRESIADARLIVALRNSAEDLLSAAERVGEVEAGLRAVLDQPWPSHYGHHDAQGTGGTNCPACITQREIKDSLRVLLLPLTEKP